MNYRHAFHAGNFADVFKHVLLARIIVYLARKPAPFRVIDTHAGIGLYDVAGPEATRTGEWRDGVGRLVRAEAPVGVRELLQPYLDAVGPCGPDGRPLDYPGSPAVARHLLRPQDRLLLSERHPDDAATLTRTMARDARVKVLTADGYTVLNASVPPPERRGLVLIDPPFEDRAEFDTLAAALGRAWRKWATGTFAVWYPIKDPAPVAGFAQAVSAAISSDHLWLELARPSSGPALRGCGLLVINPPFVLADEARRLLPFLAGVLSMPGAPAFQVTVRAGASARS